LNKVIRDGKVAVLYSPGFGAGWYTWNSLRGESEEQSMSLIFDPTIVELIEKRNGENRLDINDKIVERAEKLLPEGYFGGVDDLAIAWLPEGSQFTIDEYDGSESIVTQNELWITA